MSWNCPKCKREILFPDEIRWNGIYIKHCKDCDKKYQKEYRNTIAGKLSTRKVNIKQKFGISLETVNAKLQLQLNACAICKLEFDEKRRYVIDHNHETNEVRDLLCYPCNTSLGMLKEDENLIWNLLEYLKRWNIRKVS